MKKFYSLLILPIITIMMFYGCNSTNRTVAEVGTLYADTVSKYEISDGGNIYFADKKSGDITKPTLRVIYENSKGINKLVYENTTVSNEALTHKYKQLSKIYQRTLTMSFHYYSNWSEVFYSTIETKKHKSKEITKLYDKLKSLQRELEVFNIEKQNFEREVVLFENDSAILSASIDKLNYGYTKLIKSTLDFVNYFKDLHVAYYFNDSVQIDSAYAERIYDEGVLQLANYIYYDYLLALTRNSTTQTYYLKGTSNVYDIFNYDSVGGNKLNKVVPVNSISPNYKTESVINILSLQPSFLSSLTNTDGSVVEEKAAFVRQYEVTLNTFKQYFKLYKKVYSSVDMEGLNNFRFKTSNGFGIDNNLDDYLNTLSTADAANARIVLDFEQNKIYTFLDALVEYRSFEIII